MVTDSPRILIGSTIRQKPNILKKFFLSLQQLDRSQLNIDCLFLDHNQQKEASTLIETFRLPGANVYWGTITSNEIYQCDEQTHRWNDHLIWQVAANKNFILQYALDHQYSHVFMVDSDLLLHPSTLMQLLSTGKDIVSEIFWTQWYPKTKELPQVWQAGQYSFHVGGDRISTENQTHQIATMLSKLKTPGLYQVGGLGACTLISTRAIAAGVNYQQIPNLDYWGEDRHFCIRATVLGYPLFVDTHFPAIHLYRESALNGLQKYWENVNTPSNKLTLSMIVRNEANRYLTRILTHAKQYINAAVIIDDASSDNTAQICKEVLKDIPLNLIIQEHSTFCEENKLRQKLWEATIKTNPGWILSLDADEIFEDKAITAIPQLIAQTNVDYYAFRLYDFWDDDHFREDPYWQAHQVYRPFLLRYRPDFTYTWRETLLHCGRFPENITQLKGAISPLRLKHYGWATVQDRENKYQRYLQADPQGVYGILEQYNSILDPSPHLIKWEEEEKNGSIQSHW